VIDADRRAEFSRYAQMWIKLVKKLGGTHHGYFLPSEGASNIALALFSFDSLALYEVYRQRCAEDVECQAAFRFANESRCVLSYERSFFEPLLNECNGRRHANEDGT
jgi:hypothetical protein